jgi:hypothetical protein
MVFNNNLLLGAAGQSGAFDTTLIERSAWFDGVADWMTVSYGVNESSVRFIVGGWLRRLSFTYVDPHFIRTSQNGYPNSIFFTSADKLTIRVNNQSWTTTQVFRDVDWYHILVSIDTTATGETCHLDVNGEQGNVPSHPLSQSRTRQDGWIQPMP